MVDPDCLQLINNNEELIIRVYPFKERVQDGGYRTRRVKNVLAQRFINSIRMWTATVGIVCSFNDFFDFLLRQELTIFDFLLTIHSNGESGTGRSNMSA